ncbi:MAG TPA: radical SAM protein, partial [Polyangia bacterium]|nr:radical SAM protein [Polyangia bacterium]
MMPLSTMRVALIYPPTCDPTAPYLSVPMLTGFLRSRGIEVLPVDANLETWEGLLRRDALVRVRARLERRLARLDGRPRLRHVEQRAYAALWAARGDAALAPERIEGALACLRDRERALEPEAYDEAVQVVEAALRAISAAYAPLELSFSAYRTPFALTTPEEIALDARPERNPFAEYERALAERLKAAEVGLVGLSVVFPGQMQPAFALARRLRAALGEAVHLTVGGPALTQLLVRARTDAALMARILGPFDSAVCYEGETPLWRLCEALASGRDPTGIPNLVVRGGRLAPGGTLEDLRTLPAPDFDGLPLDRYLAPELVLPYDPTRGCYWGICTFCHYGLAEKGTAPYKERAVETVIDHLAALSARHRTRYFYFSQDSVAPKTLSRLAEGLIARGLDLRWATDLKPERYLDADRARTLRRAGAVACALGVESAAPRVLALINKGRPIEEVRAVIGNLDRAGVAVEAMCFTDFPTESAAEAMATVRFLEQHSGQIALFILGEFDLTPGSIVAQRLAQFGLREIWRVRGDELGIGLFFEQARPSKQPRDEELLDQAIARLASGWLLRRYPWAGSLSTAHTILWYDRYGPDAFRRLRGRRARPFAPGRVARARFDVAAVSARSQAAEMEIW